MSVPDRADTVSFRDNGVRPAISVYFFGPEFTF